jgi:hypothetical protein
MSFLRKSDLKKHLSAQKGQAHRNDSQPAEGAGVILRDGILITLSDQIPKEDATALSSSRTAQSGR